MEKQNKMFWGLVLENGKEYKQTSQFNFHVSRATLDLKSCTSSEPIGVYVQVDNTDYLLCNLNNKDSTQSPLELMFCEGEKIKFYATSKAKIHLTGYILPDLDDNLLDDESDISEDEDLSDDMDLMDKLNNKRKLTETLKLGNNAKKVKVQAEEAKKIIDVDTKQLVKKEQPKKNQAKPAAKKADKDSDDDDDLSIDEDEESVDINNLMDAGSDDEDDDDLDLDSNDDDLESDDEDEDMKKLKDVKNKVKFANGQNKQQNQKNKQNGSFNKPQNKSPQQNKNMQQNKNQQNTPQNKNQLNTPQNKNQQNTPQNKNQQNTPQNKSQQKHQQTPFHNKNQKNSGKKGTPFNKNKTPGSQNKEENGNNESNNDLAQDQSLKQISKKNIKKLPNGLIIEDVVDGNGPEAKKGKFCQMSYVGKLANNKVFDKSGKKPFAFRLGLGEVIKGWDLGIQGMKVGGKRRLVIPSTLAYGNSGVGQIPPNATLCFDVELKNVN